MEEKIEVRSGERLHLQWHKDTFSQAHDSADSKLKVMFSAVCTLCAFSYFSYTVRFGLVTEWTPIGKLAARSADDMFTRLLI